jgi:hypothetical protein
MTAVLGKVNAAKEHAENVSALRKPGVGCASSVAASIARLLISHKQREN